MVVASYSCHLGSVGVGRYDEVARNGNDEGYDHAQQDAIATRPMLYRTKKYAESIDAHE